MVQAELAEVFKVEPEREREGPKVTDDKFLAASAITREAAVKVAMFMLFKGVIWKARVPVEEATLNKSIVGRVEVPCIARLAWGVVVPIPTEPLALTTSKLTPVAVFTWKGSKVVVPWMRKETEEEEALTPETVPSSRIMLLAVVLAPVALIIKPLLREPESLLLKLKKSAACSWPVLTMEEKGRFRVKVLEEMLPLKIVPEVPVARVVTPVSVEAMVICPGVVVVMVMLAPATRLPGWYLVPVLSAISSWPWMVGAVEVPVPPLPTPMTPVMPTVEVPVMAMLVPAVSKLPISL